MPQPTDPLTLAYRVATVEKEVLSVKEQFRLYVSQRENELQQREKELQLKNIEQNIEQIRRNQQNSNEQQEKITIKLDVQSQKIDEVQLKALKYITNIGITLAATVTAGILVAILIFYFTHPGG